MAGLDSAPYFHNTRDIKVTGTTWNLERTKCYVFIKHSRPALLGYKSEQKAICIQAQSVFIFHQTALHARVVKSVAVNPPVCLLHKTQKIRKPFWIRPK